MIALRNEWLQVVVSQRGAELQSVRVGGREYLWQGDPRFWTGRAPVLFPVCGSLRDDWYETPEGARYTLPKHGFAKTCDFELEYHDGSAAVLLLRDSEETRAMYPYAFALRVCFRLKERRVLVSFDLQNESEQTLYFSVGAHEAYALPGGLERYRLTFPEREEFLSRGLQGPLLTPEREAVAPAGTVLPLSARLFQRDTLIFDRIRSRSCVLSRDDGGRAIRLRFEDFRHLLLWTVPGADYLCLEPWAGLPDAADSDHRIAEKPGIIRVWPRETVTRSHSFEILA